MPTPTYDDSPPPEPAPPLSGYAQLTRTAIYSFWASLPLFVLYEVLVLFVNQGRLAQVRVGADVWIKRVLASLGAGGLVALGLIVLVAAVAVYLLERRRSIPIRPRYFGWMLAESTAWAILLAFVISGFVGALFSAAPSLAMMQAATPRPGTVTMLALSLGAGLYEELFFRVLLVGGLFWALHRGAKRPRREAYLVAALVGALLFSAVHYVGVYGDPFTLPSFTFRFLFGLALNALFLARGFGIAAWTHALYDVIVTLHLFG